MSCYESAPCLLKKKKRFFRVSRADNRLLCSLSHQLPPPITFF